MNAIQPLVRNHAALFIAGSFVLASVALTLGFACAVPLAAFAVIAALTLRPAASVAAILAIWFANQVVGFACLHYPTDTSTIAWGAALGIIALLSLGAARLVLAQVGGAPGIAISFLTAFVAYQGSVYAACLLSGTDVTHFTFAVVARVFLINAASLGGLLALRALWSRSALGREAEAGHAIRHA